MKKPKQSIGLEAVPHAPRIKQRSIPLNQRSTQTELTVLQREKDRLLKERARLIKRQEYIDQRLSQIHQETKTLLNIWNEEMQAIAEDISQDSFVKDKKEWKTKPLNY